MMGNNLLEQIIGALFSLSRKFGYENNFTELHNGLSGIIKF